MRKALIIIGILIGLAVLAVAAGFFRYARVKPNYDRSVIASGLQKPVEIWRDSAGVPHVWASGDADLYFAQGYAHAQERLWQMELFRRVGEGRLSEVLGAGLVDTDKFLRTVGVWRAAALNESRVDPATRALLEAYVAGVNFWIDNHDGPLPPEFTTLRIKPERWTVRHSLAVEKIMSWDLSLYDGAASLTQSLKRLGPDKAKFLAPRDPAWGTTIVETPEIPAMPRPAALLLDGLSITRASNAWVVGGSRTTSGKPILANDMHLALRQPGVWYLMALHSPGLDVAGMTLPGVPNVIAGHNKAVAWGFTNVMLDDVDFYFEHVDSIDPNRYLTPTGWLPFDTIRETLHVKGRAEPLTFVIRTTRHGPVISDIEKRLKGREVISMKWVAADSSHSLTAIPLFNKARNAQEFLAAIPYFDNPHQNIVYADTAGHFGYQMGGRIPQRGSDRRRPPITPVPGWTADWDWRGYLPFEEHPRLIDPANGYAVTANNRQARGAVGDLISNDWDAPYRAMRIREMILATPKHDANSVHEMQLDVKDLLALRHRAAAVRAARAASLDNVAQQIAAWDGVASRSSQPAALFYAWWETLRTELGHNLNGPAGARVSRSALETALDSGSIGWAGANGRQLLDSLARTAMVKADSIARGKSWGDLHEVVAEHAIGGQVAALDKLLHLNVGPQPHAGSTTTVNVAQYSARTFPVRTSYGPSERHVVDMGNVDGVGGFILPTGQSGLPGSTHYADMFERWRNGGLWRIPLDRAAAEARIVHRMVMKPK